MMMMMFALTEINYALCIDYCDLDFVAFGIWCSLSSLAMVLFDTNVLM